MDINAAGEAWKIKMPTRPGGLPELVDILVYSPNQCASMINRLYLDVMAFTHPCDHKSILDFLRRLPALRHLIVFGSASLDAAGIRIFQVLLSTINSNLNILPVGETISLSATSRFLGHFPLHQLVSLGILSTFIPINHLPSMVIKQITFS
jgi:hypothetical protein